MQDGAEAAVAQSLKTLDERRQALAARRKPRRATSARQADAKDAPLQAALIAIDPDTGHVRAMVGGRDFADSRFNRAVQARRQPGSAFKPFVYAAALEAGLHAGDDPRSPRTTDRDAAGRLGTDDGHSTADVHDAAHGAADVEQSRRRAAAAAGRHPAHGASTPERMGIGDVPSVPSLALGSGEVTLQSLTAAYAAFANHGLRAAADRSSAASRTRDGRMLYTSAAVVDARDERHHRVPDVDDAGRRHQRGHRAPARAAWASRCRPPARRERPTTSTTRGSSASRRTSSPASGWASISRSTILPNGFAGEVAVPLWARFMKAATKGDKPQWFDMPPRRHGGRTCAVCRARLATEGCEHLDVVDAAHRSPAGRVHRVLRRRHGTDRLLRSAQLARIRRRRSRPSSEASLPRRRRTAWTTRHPRRLSPTTHPSRPPPPPVKSPRSRSAASGPSSSANASSAGLQACRITADSIASRPAFPWRDTSRDPRRAGDLRAGSPTSRTRCRGWPSPSLRCRRG